MAISTTQRCVQVVILVERLEQLEDQQGRTAPWQVPPTVLVLLKAIERERARKDGTELPPYTQEELEELRRQDLETVADRGAVGTYRDTAGWQNPEG